MARCKHYVEAFDCCAETSGWEDGLLHTESCYYKDDECPNCRYFEEAEDVVPVVRCKDCDFFNNYNPDRTYCEEHSDGWGDSIVYVDEDDYCSFGIRK